MIEGTAARLEMFTSMIRLTTGPPRAQRRPMATWNLATLTPPPVISPAAIAAFTRRARLSARASSSFASVVANFSR
jgi:hypothetical protein